MSRDNNQHTKIGIIGFGAFGQLIARHLKPYFHLYAYDPAAGLEHTAQMHGVELTSREEAAGCDIVILATPVATLTRVAEMIAPHLNPRTLVLDVGSVKVGPADIMRRCLPAHVDIVATHPLFGPQSARDGIAGLKIAVCPVRGNRTRSVAAFLKDRLGLDVIVTTPEDHDREAAMVQGLTHLIARVLVQMEPLPTRMTTKSFDLLMQAVGMVRHDAPEVFQAIEHANPYAAKMRKRFFALADQVNEELARLDPDIAKEQAA
ncbi:MULTISPECIES: prephenate dehydrogenase/arogenate dehydrogenase family protein [unclassified Ochrobactrum]|uniref:prephenate dehydrogenase/arogenate dehydrogenase family protein n=1 Tax=unclassified Ochrobactrum TaxID=239106 RepID=UPI000DEF59B7|nr:MULTISPECIES: prephenate dehydrogenase/arogenate dehydrogenase family protein [unclassified Ochrobactrum]MBQ0707782.1 prephenate dehydrogenase/arogenate dehydrogenase family protein [Ochrobactrum sp. AP1BH01-1]